MMRRLLPLAVIFVVSAGRLAAQMPDVSQMSGVPLPTGDLPTGTVSVRVVRGGLGNDVVGQLVELHAHAGNQVWKAQTDDSGRAAFANLTPGVTVHASTIVDGKRLESQEFAVPPAGGVRVILVAGASSAAAAAGAPGGGNLPPGHPPVAPATQTGLAQPTGPGTVTLGGQTRFVVELSDEALDIYYLLDVANTATHPVTTEPVVVRPPDGARGLTVLEGSSPQAKVEGDRLVIAGPFAPGITSVQFAYQLPYESGRVVVRQTLPVALSQTSVIVRKFGDMHFSSSQAGNHREMTSDGNTYIAASGSGVAAGAALEIEITGLPHHPAWPRYLALALAGLIAVAGAWLSFGDVRAQAEARRRGLEARREQLLGEIVRLDEQHLAGRGDALRYADRRQALVGRLEQVYAELDHAGSVIDAGGASPSAAAQARVSA